MKQSKVKFVVFLTVFFVSVLFSSLAFAKAYQQPPGEPPYGLKVEGAAAGTKLYGTIMIEESGFYGTPGSPTFHNVKIVLRLRQGNFIQLFYGEIIDGSFDQTKPADIQAAAAQAMGPQILSYFFGDTSLGITLKNVTDFVTCDNGSSSQSTFVGYVMADVEIAVK